MMIKNRFLFFAFFCVCVILTIPSYAAEQEEPLWTGQEPFPTLNNIETLKNVEYVRVKERQPEKDGFKWQHGAAIIRYKNDFYVSVGVNAGSENTVGEKILILKSRNDWRHWEEPVLLEPNDTEHGRSHGVFFEKDEKLWALHAKFVERGKAKGNNFPGLTMEAFSLDESVGEWINLGDAARGIWPLQEPIRLSNGGYAVGGCDENWQGAIAVSEPNDPLHWKTIKVNAPKKHYTEGNLWRDGDDLILLLRNESPQRSGTVRAAISRSKDGGRTWPTPKEGNLAMNRSKPACGVLSNGVRYLVGMSASDNENRNGLTIAVSRPGEKGLSRLRKIRDIAGPVPPGAFEASSFAYPHAMEYDGRLFVIYSAGAVGEPGNNNHIELAVIPLEELSIP